MTTGSDPGKAFRELVISLDFVPAIGGAHSWLYEVYRRWSSEVQVVTALAARSEDSRHRRGVEAQRMGALQVWRMARPIDDINLLDPRCCLRFWSHVRALENLRRGEFARVHALRAFPEGFAGYILRKLHPRRSRLITYAHGEEVLVAHTSRQLSFMAKRVYAESDLIIANSSNTRAAVLDLCPQARVVCIHPGVDSSAFVRAETEVERYRSQWGWPADTVIICTLGRMEPRKNHVGVLRAVGELRKAGLPVAYVCGGEGPEKAALRKAAGELRLERWVRFTENLSEADKPLLYLSCDIYAMPSIRSGAMIEGFGIVFLEAGAAGLPSVCGNSGGQSEAVVHGRTGLAVDGTCIEEIVAALVSLAGNRALRAEMGEAARRWAARHDWERVLKRTRDEIEKIE
jgi:phosphatidyl-myo-inositol dimannoside synthase